jgi:hypothetical protein
MKPPCGKSQTQSARIAAPTDPSSAGSVRSGRPAFAPRRHGPPCSRSRRASRGCCGVRRLAGHWHVEHVRSLASRPRFSSYPEPRGTGRVRLMVSNPDSNQNRAELARALDDLARLARDGVPGCGSASVTVLHDGDARTMSSTDGRALMIDKEQYANQSGPCLSEMADRSRCPLRRPRQAAAQSPPASGMTTAGTALPFKCGAEHAPGQGHRAGPPASSVRPGGRRHLPGLLGHPAPRPSLACERPRQSSHHGRPAARTRHLNHTTVSPGCESPEALSSLYSQATSSPSRSRCESYPGSPL